MHTTLKELLKFNSGKNCFDWNKLLFSLNIPNNVGSDEPVYIIKWFKLQTKVSIKYILECNGLENAIWALRTQKYENYCIFLINIIEHYMYHIDVPESILFKCNECIDIIKEYKKKINSYKIFMMFVELTNFIRHLNLNDQSSTHFQVILLIDSFISCLACDALQFYNNIKKLNKILNLYDDEQFENYIENSLSECIDEYVKNKRFYLRIFKNFKKNK